MKHTILISLVSLLVVSACNSQRQQGKYQSYYKDSFQEEYLNGPVKTIKGVRIYLFDRKSISRDSMDLYGSGMRQAILGGTIGYIEFDKYGIKRKWYGLDSVQEALWPPEKTRSRKKIGGFRYASIYKYFEEDQQIKATYKQEMPIQKFVFNPYRVHLNNYFYRLYHFVVKKDSTAKEHTRAFRYQLNNDGTVHKEIGLTFWDHDLNGIKDRETTRYTATYNYNNKGQLISKNFDISSVPILPDHDGQGVDFTNSEEYEPYEEYTYDESGNFTSVYMYTYEDPEKRRMVFSEEYRYNDQNKLIWMRRRATPISLMVSKHMRRTNVFEFNDKGRVKKIIAYDNDEKTIHATYSIKYWDYDAYDNWTKCYFYFGDEKEPFAEVNRIIEYYKEEKE